MAEERYVQKNIRFPETLWDRLEEVLPAEENRSQFVRDAVKDALNQRQAQGVPDVLRQVVDRLEQIDQRLRKVEGDA